MRIKSLYLENFMSYRDPCYIGFEGKPLVMIASPNESGKSTLLEAISYALFGKTRAKKDQDLIYNLATSDMVVELEFEVNRELIKVTRGRTLSGSNTFTIEGQGGKPSVLNKWLNSKLQLSYEDFTSLFYFKQGDIHQIMNSNKSQYFSRWTSNLDCWLDYEKQVKEVLKTLLDRKKEVLILVDKEPELIEDLNLLEGQLINNNLQEVILQQSLSDHSSYLEAPNRLKEIRSELNHKNTQKSTLESHLSGLRSNYKTSNLSLNQLKVGVCPILESSCELLQASNQKKVNKLDKELGKLKQEATTVKEHLDKLNNEITDLEIEARSLSEVGAAPMVDIKDLQKQLKQTHYAQGVLNSRVEACKKQLDKLPEFKKKLVEIDQEINDYSFILKACGKNGIPNQILMAELKQVQDRANFILDAFNYPKQLLFEAYTELSSLEKTCHHCGHNQFKNGLCCGCKSVRRKNRKYEPSIKVIDGSNKRDFSMESGGAQVIQSFAVRLACSIFLANLNNVSVDFLILDEVFGMLDKNNRSKAIELITSNKLNNLGFKQVFMISHSEDILYSSPDVLKISKEQGTSKAYWSE